MAGPWKSSTTIFIKELAGLIPAKVSAGQPRCCQCFRGLGRLDKQGGKDTLRSLRAAVHIGLFHEWGSAARTCMTQGMASCNVSVGPSRCVCNVVSVLMDGGGVATE